MKARYFTGPIMIALFLAIGALSFLRPHYLLNVNKINLLIDVSFILLLVTPLAKKRLGQDSSSLIKWFLKLILFQGIFITLTLALICAYLFKGPLFVPAIEPRQVEEALQPYFNWQNGFFPWSLFLMWGLSVSKAYYLKKAPPYVYGMANWFPKQLKPILKTFYDSTTLSTGVLNLNLIAVSIVLLLSYVIQSNQTATHFSFTMITVSVFSFLIPLFIIKTARKLFRRWVSKGFTFNAFYSSIIIITTLCLALAGWLNSYLMTHQPHLFAQTQCLQCANYFGNIPLSTRLNALLWGWCILWTPWIGSYLARISSGRKISEVIVGFLTLPIILKCLTFFSIKINLNFLDTVNLDILHALLAVSAWLMLVFILKNRANSNLFSAGFIEPDHHNSDRLSFDKPSKIVGLSKLTSRLFMALMSTLIIHTTAGWYGVQFQVLATAALFSLTIYVTYLSFMWDMLREYLKKPSATVIPLSSLHS